MNDKLCFYSPPFPKVKSYFDMVDISAEYGFKCIEGFNVLEFQQPDAEAAKKVRKYADIREIGFSCFSVYINLVGDDREDRIRILKGYADVAKILGSPYLHHTIANNFNDPQAVLPLHMMLRKKLFQLLGERIDPFSVQPVCYLFCFKMSANL